ncbi:rhamnogalacturonan lyase [Prevotella sp. E13-27]|uniref:rhamnogalacturonan lyase n=1 Tax=Prevotella sp. E13-27 TaxID=2938122 RepID=UPI00200AFFBF|nr:rhamnogalacturonan lyase [Prevotella sp. E13-27]MCK8622807.1 rhamnogalacturonan lyase [Prevotella sp. E13-27]
MKPLVLLSTLLLASSMACAQTKYNLKKMKTEALDRGVVAVRLPDDKVAVSWRILSDDHKHEAFDVYRNGERLTAQPMTKGGAFFIDEKPLKNEDATYEVRVTNAKHGTVAPVGSFSLCSDAPIGYFTIPLSTPQGEGRTRYTANDASVGDVDGDGQYEIFLKWEPTDAHDNAHDGMTSPTIFDCYRLNGERLWRINMGRNIRSGAHYVPFMVYDFDGDGRAEMMVKTADGTTDGQGNVIGDASVDYRNQKGRILSGPEFITVFDGLTGRALDTKPYIPERGRLAAWGDSKGNRSERYLAAVGYLGAKDANGKMTASAMFCRGYYTRTVIAAWDWDGKELRNRWTFDTHEPQWAAYAGQGNHNLRVADVDGDGMDELTYGSMAIDHDGKGLYNTGFGHGDAIHLLADPKTNRLYIWDCHENKRDGSDLRDAATGKVVFQIKSRTDVGRAMAADIDPTNYGVEMWSTDSHGVRNMKGEVVSTAKDPKDPQHDNTLIINGKYLPVNFGIWWDGDLLRELLDHETVWKYNWQEKSIARLQKFEGSFNNWTKSNPCLSADILGDWREEVIMRNRESTELRIYITPHPTDYRIDCLMQDIPYRLSVATQNVGYNQPSEAGYYIGPDRTDYLK